MIEDKLRVKWISVTAETVYAIDCGGGGGGCGVAVRSGFRTDLNSSIGICKHRKNVKN